MRLSANHVFPRASLSYLLSMHSWTLMLYDFYEISLHRLIMRPSFLEGCPIMYRSCPSVRLSVRPSVCPVLPPRGKTKRLTNTKFGRKGPWDTSTPWTNFKVKGSEVKVTVANCVVGEKSKNTTTKARSPRSVVKSK